MPSVSELARAAAEAADARQGVEIDRSYHRAAPTADGELGERIAVPLDKAAQFDALTARAQRLDFDSIEAALDYVADVVQGEL
jgi:hypothetical protein